MSVETNIDWEANEEFEPVSDRIVKRIKAHGARYWAGDNISDYIDPEEKDPLIDEITGKFESVLDSLVIDR